MTAEEGSEKNATILLVEDDPTVQVAIKFILEGQSFNMVVFGRVDEAWNWLLNNTPNVAILDINLPDDSGFNLAKKIRSNFDCGILILSNRTAKHDILHGLELGADHYITKPFLPRELLLRVNNLILRNKELISTKESKGETFFVGDWKISTEKQVMENINGTTKYLTKLEAVLLQILTSTPEKTYDRETLIQKIHSGKKRPTSRTVDLLVMGIRRKLGETTGDTKHIITVPGRGYYFKK